MTKPLPRAQQTRRDTDKVGPSTRAAARKGQKTRNGREPKAGGRLRNEIIVPVGVGAAVMCAALGLTAAGSVKAGVPLAVTVGVAGIVLTAALVAYVTWIVDGSL